MKTWVFCFKERSSVFQTYQMLQGCLLTCFPNSCKSVWLLPYDFKQHIQLLNHFWGGISISNTLTYRALLLLGGAWTDRAEHSSSITGSNPDQADCSYAFIILLWSEQKKSGHRGLGWPTSQAFCLAVILTGVAGAPSFLNSSPSSEDTLQLGLWPFPRLPEAGWCSETREQQGSDQSMVMTRCATSDHTTFINLIITASSISSSKNTPPEWGESSQILCFSFSLIKLKLANMLQHNGKFSFIK